MAPVQSWSLSVLVRGFPVCKLPARKTCQEGDWETIQNILFAHSQLHNQSYFQQHSLSTINVSRTLWSPWDSKKDGPCSHWALRNGIIGGKRREVEASLEHRGGTLNADVMVRNRLGGW